MGLFGGEKITLILEKYDFKPGENIKGTVFLNFRKPTTGRKLNVSLIGQRKERYRDHDGHTQYRYENVFSFTVTLSGEMEYQSNQFPFDLKIPENVLSQCKTPEMPQMEGTLGKLAVIGHAMSMAQTYPVEWLILSHLDIPKKFDVKKSQEIIISE